MTATAIALKSAVRDLIVSEPTLSGLTPRTTLSAPTIIGGNTLSIDAVTNTDGSSQFRSGMRLQFYDDLGERAMTVQDVSSDGVTVTLETSATVGFNGLAAIHPTTTLLYSNIVATRGPFALSSSIQSGFPLVAITVTEGMYGGPDDVSQWTYPTYQIHVQTSRMLYRPGTKGGVDPELWNDQQEDLTITDIETIAEVLLTKQNLITDFFPSLALQFGRLGGGGDKIRISYGPRNVESTSDWHYIGVAQLIVTTNGTPLG